MFLQLMAGANAVSNPLYRLICAPRQMMTAAIAGAAVGTGDV
jgi:hypothetical protein